MSDQINKNQNKSEKVMEAYYSFIGECHINNIASELESKKEELNHIQVPDTLNKWFEDFNIQRIRKEKHIFRAKQLKRISSRVAMIFLILIASLSIITMSVETMRVKVLNFFIETTEKYTSIKVGEKDSEEEILITWDSYFYPAYLPEGFKLESADQFNETKFIQFSREKEVIQFVQAPNGTDFQLDTEKGNISEVMINTTKGILVEKEDKKILFWNNNESSFYIVSDIDSQTIIDISKSLEKK